MCVFKQIVIYSRNWSSSDIIGDILLLLLSLATKWVNYMYMLHGVPPHMMLGAKEGYGVNRGN